jgi:bloom syndrome protein
MLSIIILCIVDFRPSYTKLSYFKTSFPAVPVLALTATATARVQHDVVAQLGLKSCLLFRSSFNRPNLRYEVRKKPKGPKTLEDMGSMIVSKFSTKLGSKRRLQCGIIYCATVKKCEEVADKLEKLLRDKLGRPHGRRVKHYHGKLSSAEREQVQHEWTNGEVSVIVATLAFGMGINKADVRFVIHFCVPKSLEGYLQESGRAGRDGLTAHCIVYYSRADVLTQKFMIDKNREEQKASFGTISAAYETQHMHNIENLHAMSAYCEEQCSCRRSMLLQHFGENFNVSECRGSCDNCKAAGTTHVSHTDMTHAALVLIGILRQCNRLSISLLAGMFVGSLNSSIKKKNLHEHSQFGAGKPLKISTPKIESVIRKMINMVSCPVVYIS